MNPEKGPREEILKDLRQKKREVNGNKVLEEIEGIQKQVKGKKEDKQKSRDTLRWREVGHPLGREGDRVL